MLVPLEWLREYCDPPLSTAELAERLTLTGTQVERSFRHGPPAPEHYVIGRVLAAGPHPNADRLRVCEVDVGVGEPATIVCGAPNVAAGQTVAVARPGARMADGRTLGAAKLRGIVSNGMILADDEIALGSDHAGIMVLDDGPPPGTPLAEVLPLGTDVLELEVTPNRPDCLAVYGVAREVHAATGAPLAPRAVGGRPGLAGGRARRRQGRASSAPISARASPRGCSRRSRSARRRSGSRRACWPPGCARSPTSSTSPTT